MSHSPLAPCPSCLRHVRIHSAVCPFCAAVVAIEAASVVPAATTPLSRAAAFTFATTLALGCATTQTATVEPAPTIMVAPADPSPPVTPVAAPQDQGATMAIYGSPTAMADAGAPAVDAPAVDVPVRPARPSGSIGVRYGSPPRPTH